MVHHALIVSLLAGAAPSLPAAPCGPAMTAYEHSAHLPTRMLEAIGLVESGRADPRTGRAVAWPWTIDVAGTPKVFETKPEAIAAVQAAQSAGIQSIDVGCMQINLLHHPRAFANLDEAFDPISNVAYATTFLRELHGRTGNWGSAVAAYHSLTPALGAAYAQRVAAIWPLARTYGLTPAALSTTPKPTDPADLIDPQHVMTPEFRAEMVQQAAYRHARDVAMGLAPADIQAVPASPRHSRRPHIVQAEVTDPATLVADTAPAPG